MPTVAVFPLFAVRRACKYQHAITSHVAGFREPSWTTHLLHTGATVYLINASTGDYRKG